MYDFKQQDRFRTRTTETEPRKRKHVRARRKVMEWKEVFNGR